MITYTIEENRPISEEEFLKGRYIANEQFECDKDIEQIATWMVDYKLVTETIPECINFIKKDNKIIGYSFFLPSNEKDMIDFLENKINERELFNRIKEKNEWENSNCVYLCAVQIDENQRRNGLAFEAVIKHIEFLQKKHPALKKFYYWKYSEGGERLANKISKELNIEIKERKDD